MIPDHQAAMCRETVVGTLNRARRVNPDAQFAYSLPRSARLNEAQRGSAAHA